MSWIKRNLFFTIGGAIAVVLLGLAGYYCYSRWELNQTNLKTLDDAYGRLKAIQDERPNPGNDKVNNTEIAKDQQQQVRQLIDKMQSYFTPIPPIINSTNINDEQFSGALRATLKQLAESAGNAGVMLPVPRYTFSFEAQVSKGTFAPGSLPPLSQQLSEVKAVCSVLFDAKINTLYTLRRERVSSDDTSGLAADYLDIKSVTNDLAVLTPYEVRFSCFSGELGKVLAGYASDPHGFVVKIVNVEPDAPTTAGGGASAAPEPAATAGGMPVVLDEKQLRVTLALTIVKLLPKK